MQSPKSAPLQVKPPDDFVPLSPDLIGEAFPRLFARKAKDQPEKIAVTSEGGALTYRELDLRSNGLARRIVSALGPGKEPVAILAGHDSRAILALMGAFKSGRPYVGLDSSFPPERMKQILSDSKARMILTDESQEKTARELLSDGIVMLSLGAGDLEGEEQGPDVVVAPTDLALVYYTSGSTGKPKGVAWSHQQLVSNCIYQAIQLKTSPSDRCMLVSSIGFASSRSNVYDTLLVGGAICMYDIKNKGTASIADWLLSERVTIYRSSSPVFRSIFSALPDGLVFPDLRLLLLGAQTATAPDVELYRKHTLPSCVFGNHFALTEAGVLANFLLDHQTPILWETVPVAAEVMGDKEILLLGEDGEVVKPGEKGEIVVRGQYLSSGYLNQPELTAQKFKTDPQDSHFTLCYTGDIGCWNESGYLEHLGRKDSLVKIRGYNVDLHEIERALQGIASVKEAAVIARSFPNLPEVKQLVAYVVPAPGESPTPRELRERLAAALPAYMVPPVYVTLEKMPLTPSLKLDRKRLPEVAVRQSLSEADLPADDIERRLIAIWQKCFNLEMIGAEDDFFELGGDSLLASLMFAAMEREFGRTYPLNLLLDYATIRKLAAVVRRPDELAISALYPLKPGGTQLPLFIFPGGEGDVLTLKELA
ncbi:MAG: non-ribosomal peptide synthetase, partial [Chloroflexota bacterium]